jgi:hypothetical protein
MPLSWVAALKKYNEGKGKWCVPRKGTPEHAEVMALMGKPAAGGAGRSPSPSPEPPKRRPHPVIGRELSESQKVAARKFIAEMKEKRAEATREKALTGLRAVEAETKARNEERKAAAAAAKKPLTGADLPTEVAEKIISMVPPSEKTLASIFFELKGSRSRLIHQYNMIMFIIYQIFEAPAKDYGFKAFLKASKHEPGSTRDLPGGVSIHSITAGGEVDTLTDETEADLSAYYGMKIITRRRTGGIGGPAGIIVEAAVPVSDLNLRTKAGKEERAKRYDAAQQKAAQTIVNLTMTKKGDVRDEFASFFLKRTLKPEAPRPSMASVGIAATAAKSSIYTMTEVYDLIKLVRGEAAATSMLNRMASKFEPSQTFKVYGRKHITVAPA